MLTRYDQPAETWRNLGALEAVPIFPGCGTWREHDGMKSVMFLLGVVGIDVRHDSNIGELFLVIKP
jgi:hypothetical protein